MLSSDIHYALLGIYNKFVKNGYKLNGIDIPNEHVGFFLTLKRNKELYGFSCSRDYEDFVGTLQLYDESLSDCSLTYEPDCDLTFESKWNPLTINFLNKLSEFCPNFYYSYDGEEGWGGEIEYNDGELFYRTEWGCPEYSEEQVVVDGNEVEIYRLINWDKDGYNPGYYKDDFFNEYLGETLEEAIKYLRENGL